MSPDGIYILEFSVAIETSIIIYIIIMYIYVTADKKKVMCII